MGGLPLALQVVGSYLYKKTDRKVWEDVRKQLKRQPHRDVQKILRISYDALEDGHKQIFLDIACYFIGEISNYAMYIWEDDGLYPSQGIEELKLRCLIKIGDGGRFEMHDQLRDLGRSIFCEGQLLNKHSGPWDNNYKGTSKILSNHGGGDWFDDFLRGASIGDSNELLSEIRWLQWEFWEDDPPLPTTNLHLPNLSVLDLSWSWGITEDWEVWRSSFMTAKRLQVLELQRCPNLRCTLDLSAFTLLKILTFRFCRRLEHLHPSIGKLKSLVSLDLYGCESLEGLPKEVGELKDLEELVLDESGITEIPTSIGSLRKLKTLSACYCKSLREIPSSIGDLQNLQHLDLSGSGLEKLPSAIGRLKNLETLRLMFCHSLKGAIPSEIGDLSSLEFLDFSWSPISDLPESIRNLSSLQRLWLKDCDNLGSLPKQLPLGLKDLRVSCQSRRLPQLSSLIHLEGLHLWSCHLLEVIPELPSRLLKLSVWECGKLKLLKLDGCKYLETLQITRCSSIERLLCPESRCLKNLAAVECNNLVEIQGLHGAKFLKALDFTGCESMEMLPNLTGCEKLQCLIVRNCKKLTQLRGLEKLDSIDLDISGCDSLEAIPKLSGTRVLRNYERELSYDSWSDDSSIESD